MAQSASPQIRAVLFDFGMVLSGPPEPGVWKRMLAGSGLDEKTFDAGYWAHRHEYDRGTLTGAGYWQAVARHGGREFTADQVAELIAADTDLWTDLNVPMVEWAARLQRAGVRTGILSNIGDAMAEGICAKLPWVSAFDHCTWSYELRIAKPEPAIYLMTAKSLGVEPGHILFVDDREENIAAALELGFVAIRYTSHAEFERTMRARGLGSLLDVGAESREPVLASMRDFLGSKST